MYEKEFIQTFDYVALDQDNYDTFSSFYLKLIIELGSYIEISLNLLCNFFGCKKVQHNIIGCIDYLKQHANDFFDIQINLFNSEFKIKTWQECGCIKSKSPCWWYLHNKLKHSRYEFDTRNQDNCRDRNKIKQYYKYANLKNAIRYLASLYQILIYTHFLIAREENLQFISPLPGSRLFSTDCKIWDGEDLNSVFHVKYDESTGNITYLYPKLF